ncbi:YceI family protein [Arcobacter vandammei]|uniref:YceI family protein n=1 Tax=Arcobacter vandammei TaxID=2782243 RepID=UPI0018DFD9A7|nr:YceI family protein [Arcobacter vandammei]
MNLFKLSFSTIAFSTLIFASNYKIESTASNADFLMKFSKNQDLRIEFTNIKGGFDFDDKKLTLESLKSDIELKDFTTSQDEYNILVEKKIFNIEKFPKIKFTATDIEQDKIYGDLTINNVTKNIELDLENSGDFFGKIYLKLSGKIKRSYFDLTWDELLDTGSSSFDNDIELELNLEANKEENQTFTKIIEKNKK